MKTKFIRIVLIMLTLFFWGIHSVQGAVSLQSQIDYMKKLQQEAQVLERQGYYDESIEKSLEVQRLAGEIDAIIAVLKKWYQLQRNIAVAKQIGADKIAPDEFNLAIEFYKSAEQAFVDNDLEQVEFDVEEGIYYIDLAIELTRDSFNQRITDNEEVTKTTHNVELAKVDGEYRVRLIPEKRDCLWRIAEYDFIYGNPWQWKLIYNANRGTIKDPDLIYPGQRLVIPPLPYEPELE